MDRGLGKGKVRLAVVDKIRQQARRVLVIVDCGELVEGKAGSIATTPRAEKALSQDQMLIMAFFDI